MKHGPLVVQVGGYANGVVLHEVVAAILVVRLQLAGVYADLQAGSRQDVRFHLELAAIVGPGILGTRGAGGTVAGAAVAVDRAAEGVGRRLVRQIEAAIEGAVPEP